MKVSAILVMLPLALALAVHGLRLLRVDVKEVGTALYQLPWVPFTLKAGWWLLWSSPVVSALLATAYFVCYIWAPTAPYVQLFVERQLLALSLPDTHAPS